MKTISYDEEDIMSTHAELRIQNTTAYITLRDEVERHPCTLDWTVLRELGDCLEQIAASQEAVKVVVLESASPKSFVVGANIAVLEELTPESIMDWVRLGHDVFNRFARLPAFTIAKVKYMALGGGLELAMACDTIIASDEAKLGQPEATLGVMPGWGGSYRLAQLVGPNRAKEMFATGEHLSAREAYEWGLVSHVVPAGEIDGYVDEMAARIAGNDSRVIAYLKRFINDTFYRGLTHNAEFEALSSSICLNSPETKARLSDFFAKRKKKPFF